MCHFWNLLKPVEHPECDIHRLALFPLLISIFKCFLETDTESVIMSGMWCAFRAGAKTYWSRWLSFNWLQLTSAQAFKKKKRKKKKIWLHVVQSKRAETNPNLAYPLKISGDRVDEKTYTNLEHCGWRSLFLCACKSPAPGAAGPSWRAEIQGLCLSLCSSCMGTMDASCLELKMFVTCVLTPLVPPAATNSVPHVVWFSHILANYFGHRQFVLQRRVL